jgi:hypothetical protein
VQGTGRFTDNVSLTKSNAELSFGSSAFPSRIAANGQNLNIYNYNNAATGTTGALNIGSAGTIIYLAAGFQYTGAYFKSDFADSGVTNNGSHNEIQIAGTVNMTFAGSGVQRSLYINKTITAASSYRAIEWTNSSHWGLYGSGSANNYLQGALVIGTTSIATSAMLQADSTTKGFLPPRMTSAQRTAISTPSVGLIVYQTDATEGTYEYTSGGWRLINAAGGGGSGTVTSVSVVSANGFAGTVANASTTPAITISTTVTGLLKGNGTAISAATAGTDYLTPADEDYSVISQTSNYTETVTRGTKIIKCDTTSGGITVTLPTAVGNKALLIIKKVAGSGALTIDGNGTETIDGGTTATIIKVYESVTLVSDNSNWQIV